MQGVSRRRPEAPLKLASRSVGVHFWALGVWALGVGRWVLGVGCLGVGCAAGSPPGPTLKRALGRSLAACFAPPWLLPLPPTSPPPPPSPPTPTSPPPPPKGREREPRAAAYPPNASRGPNTPYIRRHRGAEEIFLGVGCSILGVGCLRTWALGVYGLGRWVFTTDFGRWVLGVGCL